MPTTPTLTLYLGADHSVRVDVVDAAGDPLNMTGMALAFVVRQAINGALVTSKTTDSGITIGDGLATGDRATIAIGASNLSTGWPATREYRWALWRTDDGSTVPLTDGIAVLKRAAAVP